MIFYIFLTVIIIYQGVFHCLSAKSHQKHIEGLHVLWESERKDLYNRIQASNYAEYNAGEVKKIKAEKDEPPKYNLL